MPDQHDVLVLRRWHTCPMTSAIVGNAINERNRETLVTCVGAKKIGDKGGWLVFGWLVGLVVFKTFVIFVPKIGEMIQFD